MRCSVLCRRATLPAAAGGTRGEGGMRSVVLACAWRLTAAFPPGQGSGPPTPGETKSPSAPSAARVLSPPALLLPRPRLCSAAGGEVRARPSPPGAVGGPLKPLGWARHCHSPRGPSGKQQQQPPLGSSRPTPAPVRLAPVDPRGSGAGQPPACSARRTPN